MGQQKTKQEQPKVIFTDLREHQQRLQACGGFIKTLLAREGPESSASALLTEFMALKENGVEVVSFVRQMVISRAVADLAAQHDFPALLNEVDFKKEDSTYGFKDLGKDAATSLQKKVLMETVWTYAKIEGDKGNKDCTKVACALGRLRSFVSSIPATGFVLDSAFSAEIDNFRAVLHAHLLEDPTEIARVEKVKETMVLAKTGPFHKCLTVYCTGISSRVQADKFFEAIHADKGHCHALRDLLIHGQAVEGTKLALKDFHDVNKHNVVDGVHVPASVQARVSDMSKKYFVITSKASPLFKKQNKDHLDIVAALLVSVANMMIAAAEAIFNMRVNTLADQIIHLLGEDASPMTEEQTQALDASLHAALEKCTVVPDSELAVVNDIAGPDKHKTYLKGAAAARGSLLTLHKSISFIVSLWATETDFESKMRIDLFDSLRALCAMVPEENALHRVSSSLQQQFSKEVRDHLASSLKRVGPFVDAVMEKKEAKDVIAASLRKNALQRVDSDVQDDHMQDHIAMLDDKARLARENLAFTGMDSEIEIGEQVVPIRLAVLLPQICRASRACHTLASPPKNAELPEHLESTLDCLKDS